jgi:hypothetical protein
MKKIEDYLHFYLPVKVELNNGGGKVYNRTAVAVGNMDNEYKYVTLRMGEGVKAFTHSILFSEPNRVKPILRPLHDMTEEEAILLFKKVSLFDLSECEFEFGENYSTWINANFKGRIIDSIKFVGDNVEMMNNDGTFSAINPIHSVFEFYLSKGFDLFGLIDEGLAVNACDLKTGSIA